MESQSGQLLLAKLRVILAAKFVRSRCVVGLPTFSEHGETTRPYLLVRFNPRFSLNLQTTLAKLSVQEYSLKNKRWERLKVCKMCSRFLINAVYSVTLNW